MRFDGFDVYRGVPYAQPTGRFEHAEMVSSLVDFDARNSGPTCFQALVFSYVAFEDPSKNLSDFYQEGLISEDCLTMDIYIPQTEAPKGILLWIHGGGYVSGDSRTYSGIEHVKSQGNIVVVIQYRLGILGFFNAFDTATNKSIGGNYG